MTPENTGHLVTTHLVTTHLATSIETTEIGKILGPPMTRQRAIPNPDHLATTTETLIGKIQGFPMTQMKGGHLVTTIEMTEIEERILAPPMTEQNAILNPSHLATTIETLIGKILDSPMPHRNIILNHGRPMIMIKTFTGKTLDCHMTPQNTGHLVDTIETTGKKRIIMKLGHRTINIGRDHQGHLIEGKDIVQGH